MEVNEKCDVYSFGVVAMEIMMGRHPGDFISSLLSSASSSTTAATSQNTLFKDILDQRLPPPEHRVVAGVVYIAELAFACLNAVPKQVASDFLIRWPPLS
jgi:serine/threonine protein kinase